MMATLVKCRCGYERATKRELRRRESVGGITAPCEACAKWANGHCACDAPLQQQDAQLSLNAIRERQAQKLLDLDNSIAAAIMRSDE